MATWRDPAKIIDTRKLECRQGIKKRRDDELAFWGPVCVRAPRPALESTDLWSGPLSRRRRKWNGRKPEASTSIGSGSSSSSSGQAQLACCQKGDQPRADDGQDRKHDHRPSNQPHRPRGAENPRAKLLGVVQVRE